jgi:DNA-binding beta-propeller fold protein YncE
VQFSGRDSRALAHVAALTLLLAACGGDGSSGQFPTAVVDELPPGSRIDVSGKNLFPMHSGDFWSYNVIPDIPIPGAATTTTRQVVADDGAGHVSLQDDDGGGDITPYTVTADGLLNTRPLGDAPASATNITGAIFDYATPLYPVGAVRRHVRSGSWGEDLDGDNVPESFRFEYTQVFLGFETLQLTPTASLSDVAHFRNAARLTIRPTGRGLRDASLVFTEEAWFAPGIGMVKALREAIDGDGIPVDRSHTLVFSHGVAAGKTWDFAAIPAGLSGSFVDLRLRHKALAYDSLRNVYYASIPVSAADHPNTIATIDPATAQVTYSAPVGSDPGFLALAPDASALYVGLDGTAEIAKLALPSMNELGRTSIALSSGTATGSFAESIAVSPADPSMVVVSVGDKTVLFGHAGLGLFRELALQASTNGSGFLAFDPTGTTLYALSTEDGRLHRMQVSASALTHQLSVVASDPRSNLAAPPYALSSLQFANNRLIAGHVLYDAPDLTRAGMVSTSGDCQLRRTGNQLLCLNNISGQGRILIADPGTFVTGASLLFTEFDPSDTTRRLVEGPAGQVAISYPAISNAFVSRIRLFTSAQLMTIPSPSPPVWPVNTLRDASGGQMIDIAITHNALAYDSARNVYYASIPGSIVGAGNSIAVIDPATGQVTHSAPVGSEPNALAIAADGSVLYVGLDGSAEVLRLALPSMTPAGRARLVTDSLDDSVPAFAIAVSPADPNMAAAALANKAEIALLRDMVLQPKRAQSGFGDNLITFDSAGDTLYGLERNITPDTLRGFQVAADGVTQNLAVPGRKTVTFPHGLSFTNGRVISSAAVFDAPGLGFVGTVPGAEDCWAARAGGTLLCLNGGAVQVLVVDSGTLAITAQPFIAGFDQSPKFLVQGPAHQVALSGNIKVRLFTNPQLP